MLLWLTIGTLFAIAFAMVFRYDGWVLNHVEAAAPDHSILRRVLKLSRWFFWWPVIAAALAVALRRGERTRLVVTCLLTLVIGAALLYTLKNAIGRARPDEHFGAYAFHPFGFVDGFDSFPSGHTTEYFILAIMIGMSFPKLRHFSLIAAVLAATSRVAQDRHFGSDILGGVLLAIVSVRLAILLAERIDVARIRVPEFLRARRSAHSAPTTISEPQCERPSSLGEAS